MNPFRFLTDLRQAAGNLRAQATRTLLTALGIVFGVGSVIGMLSIGAGAREESLRMIEKEGRGVVVLIRDLRPKSVSEWIASRAQPKKPAEGARERRQVEIGVGSQILTDLGVRDMVLLTNSPAHVYVGLEGFGLRIVGTRRIE